MYQKAKYALKCARCCAQQTGVHEMVVEALLNSIYLSAGRANTYTHKKTLLGRTPVSCE
jgi:hypothetical protein